MKRSEKMLTKYELAEQVGVNHNSITFWRKLYEQGGIAALMKHHQGGHRKSIVKTAAHKAIEKIQKTVSAAIKNCSAGCPKIILPASGT